jgi:hypothetical protein
VTCVTWACHGRTNAARPGGRNAARSAGGRADEDRRRFERGEALGSSARDTSEEWIITVGRSVVDGTPSRWADDSPWPPQTEAEMRRTSALIALTGLVMLVGSAGAATAAPGDYVLVSDKVTLERQDDGTAAASVSLINLTDQDARVTVAAAQDSGCKAEVSPTTLLARRQQSLKATLTGCQLSDKKGVTLTLTAGARSFSVAATPATGAQPDWGLLRWFLWAAIVAVIPTM